MRLRAVLLIALAALLTPTVYLLAQDAPDAGEGVIRQLNSIDRGTLSALMIFGTGLVASLCWGIGWIISCLRQSGSNAEGVREEVAALEARVAAIEQALGSPVVAGSDRSASH